MFPPPPLKKSLRTVAQQYNCTPPPSPSLPSPSRPHSWQIREGGGNTTKYKPGSKAPQVGMGMETGAGCMLLQSGERVAVASSYRDPPVSGCLPALLCPHPFRFQCFLQRPCRTPLRFHFLSDSGSRAHPHALPPCFPFPARALSLGHACFVVF